MQNPHHPPNSVSLIAQQFQNMARLSHQAAPPPSKTQRPPSECGVSESGHRHHQPQVQLYESGPPLLYQAQHHHQVTTTGPYPGSQQSVSPCPTPEQPNQPQPKGVHKLMDDLQWLLEDHATADIVFLADQTETAVYAHQVILRARCQSFQNSNRNEVCQKLGVTVSRDNESNTSVIKWPQVKVDVLQNVLQYIYTSKIQLSEQNIFECMAIGNELGLNELSELCQETAQNNLTIHNACSYLDSALRIKSRIEENQWSLLVQMCMRFISENSADCVKTDAFLNISKQTMTYLVMSDYFSLEEADIFRCTLDWAKHQTGVHKPTQQWIEDERARITTQLTGVINHIRILLIDSQVFAEELEPTGVVPIELSLERYRYAALAGANKQPLESQNKLLRPRLLLTKLFANSKLLTHRKLEETLNEWYGVPKQTWKMIFRASEHNFSADAFHAHCDFIEPTFVLVLSSKGYLSGGFSDKAWSRGNKKGSGRYEPSERAFLFRLHSPEPSMQSPVRFDIKKKIFACGHINNCGPVFGAGADLMITDNCHLNDESYSNLPHSYDGEDACPESLFGSYNFTVIDYEIFTVKKK